MNFSSPVRKHHVRKLCVDDLDERQRRLLILNIRKSPEEILQLFTEHFRDDFVRRHFISLDEEMDINTINSLRKNMRDRLSKLARLRRAKATAR